MSRNITALTIEELKTEMARWQEAAFRAEQVFSWIYKKGVDDFAKMANLPVSFKTRLREHFHLFDIGLTRRQESTDGTAKYLFSLPDGNSIEAVVIPQGERATACLSSQVGCKFACSFCASGMLGFKRDLTAAEIINELLYLKNNSKDRKITHVVFMGTGEPLDNYENVLRAIRIINAEYSFNIGARRITISTCGIVPAIKRLSEEGLQVELSISLHAADDRVRSRLLPVNKKYPLKDLIGACREYIHKTNRQVTFEYVLLNNINSSLQDAVKLATIVRGLNCKVNLIPCNRIEEFDLYPPSHSQAQQFKDCLCKAGVHVTLRRPRGQDIASACGQLRLRYEKT
jgi:23S rRNA (adenine2503-C2)-methyltransferase